MNILNWLKPGIKVKRWIALGTVGIAAMSFGIGGLIFNSYFNILLLITAIITGILIIAFAIKRIMNSLFELINHAGLGPSVDISKLSDLVYEKRLLINGPKIVAIGGGTGLSTMLRGIKHYTSNITAIVTVADDGGGSGVLRETLGILPPGDIRNCLLALADTEPVMEELLQYRFNDGMLKGQSFGNLFIAAMDGISENFEVAIKKMSDVLAVTGKVLPVTLANVRLFAELENGVIIEGESNISKREQNKDVPIKRVFLKPDGAMPLSEAINAIDEADAVILGPGSLYTSIIPNLLVDDIVKHIEKSNAIKIYISNIMTQPGETTGFTVCDHIDTIQKYSKKRIIDCTIINNGSIPSWLRGKYTKDGAREVPADIDKIKEKGIEVVVDNLVYIYKNLLRHNSRKLAELIMKIILERKLSSDKKRMIEYYYLNERLNSR
ncbi:gluconeogenesis factor [Oxobacter pfennigii]|uniref:Putative gluconeogenesis factor n=1 Tax=Oxobacter pfennigii TaxID=36849 RepID=A0A0P8W6P5_9CLOT|nr:gluconeogenesis factor YvcK family protein [Oxobacter pfennigii]KPU43437.1 gluconeogenesis factor [Oxobacter pfennigii]